MINLNTNEITETIKMIRDEHLDIRTITMGNIITRLCRRES